MAEKEPILMPWEMEQGKEPIRMPWEWEEGAGGPPTTARPSGAAPPSGGPSTSSGTGNAYLDTLNRYEGGDILSKFIRGLSWEYAPDLPIPETASPLYKMAGGAAHLAGMGLGIALPSKFAGAIPVAGRVLGPLAKALLGGAPPSISGGVIPAMVKGGLSAAKVGATHGILSKPEEGGSRMVNALQEALAFGSFGLAGPAIQRLLTPFIPVAKNAISKLAANEEMINTAGKLGQEISAEALQKLNAGEKAAMMALHTISSGAMGGGAGFLEPAENWQQRATNILMGAGTFGLAHLGTEAMGGIPNVFKRGQKGLPPPEGEQPSAPTTGERQGPIMPQLGDFTNPQEYINAMFGVRKPSLSERNQAEQENVPAGTQLDMLTGQNLPYYAQPPSGVLPMQDMEQIGISRDQLEFDFGRTLPTVKKPISILPLESKPIANQFGIMPPDALRRQMETERASMDRMEQFDPDAFVQSEMARVQAEMEAAAAARAETGRDVYREEGGRGQLPTLEEMKARDANRPIQGRATMFPEQQGLPGMEEAATRIYKTKEPVEEKEKIPTSKDQLKLDLKKRFPKNFAQTAPYIEETKKEAKETIPDFGREVYAPDIRGAVEESNTKTASKKAEDFIKSEKEMTSLEKELARRQQALIDEGIEYGGEQSKEQLDLFRTPGFRQRTLEAILDSPKGSKQKKMVREYLELLKKYNIVKGKRYGSTPPKAKGLKGEQQELFEQKTKYETISPPRGIRNFALERERDKKKANEALAQAKKAGFFPEVVREMQVLIGKEEYKKAIELLDDTIENQGRLPKSLVEPKGIRNYKASLKTDEERLVADEFLDYFKSDGRLPEPVIPDKMDSDRFYEIRDEMQDAYQRALGEKIIKAEGEKAKEAEIPTLVPSEKSLIQGNKQVQADVLVSIFEERLQQKERAIDDYLGTLSGDLKDFAKKLASAMKKEMAGKKVTFPKRPEGMKENELEGMKAQITEALETDKEAAAAWKEIYEEYLPGGVEGIRESLRKAGVKETSLEEAELIVTGLALKGVTPYGLWKSKIYPTILSKWYVTNIKSLPKEGLKLLQELAFETEEKMLLDLLKSKGLSEEKAKRRIEKKKNNSDFWDSIEEAERELESEQPKDISDILKDIEAAAEPEGKTATAKPYEGLTPGTPEWKQAWKENPKLQNEMLEYQKAHPPEKDKLIGYSVDEDGVIFPVDRSMPSNEVIHRVTDVLNKVFEQAIGKGIVELKFMNAKDMPIDVEKLRAEHNLAETNYEKLQLAVNGNTYDLTREQLKYLVQLTYQDEPGMVRAGIHELGEVIVGGFLDARDRALLIEKYTDPANKRHWKENFADALADYFFTRNVPESKIGKIFRKIENVFNRALNALIGEGWRNHTDIFDEILSGEYVYRHSRTIEERNNTANLLGYAVDEAFGNKDRLRQEALQEKEFKDYWKDLTEFRDKYFPNKSTDDLGWAAKHLGLPFYRSLKYYQEGRDFKRIFDVFMTSLEVRDKEFRGLTEGTMRDYLELTSDQRKVIEESYRLDDEFGFKSGKNHNDTLKERGLSEKQIKGYWQVVDTIRKAKMLEVRTDVANRLYPFRKRTWFNAYVDEWLFGPYKKWDSFTKKMKEYGMPLADIEDMTAFETSPDTARFRSRIVNQLNEETGKWEEKETSLQDEVKMIRKLTSGSVYLPRERGDGKYFVRVVRYNKDGKEIDTWDRKHTNWMPIDLIERLKLGKLINRGNAMVDSLNAEAKKRGIDDGSYFALDSGTIDKLPEELRLERPEAELIKIQAFLEYVSKKAKDRADKREKTPFSIDPQSMDVLTGGILDQTHKELMALSARGSHNIKRDFYTDFDGKQRAIGGYETKNINEVIVRRLERAANYAGRSYASLRAYEALGNIDVANYSGLFSFSKKFIVDQLRGNSQVDRMVNMARAGMFHTYLGFSMRPVALQFSQNFVLGMGVLARDMNRGRGGMKAFFTLKPEKYMLTAMKDISKDVKNHKNLTPIEQQAMNDMLITGELEAQFTKQARGELMRKTGGMMPQIIEASSWMFSQAEIWNRKVIALARFRAGQKELGETYEQSIEAAKTIINKAHFIYKGSLNLPSFARGGSLPAAAGRAAITLRTYTMGFLETLASSMKDEQGKVALDVVMRSMAYIFLLGGAASIPWLDDLFDRYERGIFGMGGYPLRTEMKKLMGKEDSFMKTFMATGLVGALAGTDISGSLRIGLPSLDAQGIEDMFIGVYGGVGDKFANAVDSLKYRDWGRATETLMPSAIENVFKARRMYKEGATNIRGHKIYDENDEQLKLTGSEAALQSLGFRPVRLGEYSTETRVAQNVRQFYQGQRDTISARVKKAAGDDEKMRDILEDVNQYNEEIQKYNGGIPFITGDSLREYMKGRRPDKLRRTLGEED